MGGLSAAVDLSARGLDVLVVEKSGTPGGKLREVKIDGLAMDAGPTVFTLRQVFEELFADAGTSLAAHVTLKSAEVLARHAWDDGARLDLFADLQRSAAAIGEFAGAAEARRYLAFSAQTKRMYEMLERPFLRSQRPNPVGLTRAIATQRLSNLWRLQPFTGMWKALQNCFTEPRLQQLFGRYATYCGSSPFLAPATLMLIAHVERDGVWLVEGGMHRIAVALANVAASHGAQFRYSHSVSEVLLKHGRVAGVRLDNGEHIDAAAVIVNADAAAVTSGLLGCDISQAVPAVTRAVRSLSAMTWNLRAESSGFSLLRHTVFFSNDYAAEFDELFAQQRLPSAPTVYVCAQDRDDYSGLKPDGAERLLCLINAPATGDSHAFTESEIEQCTARTFAFLDRCGLQLHYQPHQQVVTTPSDFNRLFPGTGGALYGPASHGWQASFQRPKSRTMIAGLYLAGGSTHPGAGVPMAALSGRLAAASLLQDLNSTRRLRTMVTPGGISTRSAMTEIMD
jgi:1-hydroxycarotenoid 3,4-desaturase